MSRTRLAMYEWPSNRIIPPTIRWLRAWPFQAPVLRTPNSDCHLYPEILYFPRATAEYAPQDPIAGNLVSLAIEFTIMSGQGLRLPPESPILPGQPLRTRYVSHPDWLIEEGSIFGFGLLSQYLLPELFPNVQWATEADGTWNIVRPGDVPELNPWTTKRLFVDLRRPPWSDDPLVSLAKQVPLTMQVEANINTASAPLKSRVEWLIVSSTPTEGPVMPIPHCACHVAPVPCEVFPDSA